MRISDLLAGAAVAAIFMACGEDGGLDKDVHLPDAQADATGSDTSGSDSVAPDGADDTASAPDTAADSADAPDTTDASDTAVDTAADTSAPECVVDGDCPPLADPANECTVARCTDGRCGAGARDCADGDPCTVDACDPHGGCVHTTLTLDAGPSRFTYCPDALFQADALAACVTRGEALAVVSDEGVAAALEPLLAESGAAKAWVASGSAVTCPAPDRIVIMPCKSLQHVADATCADITDCGESLPFVCEQRCDDLDPCTDDIMEADGKCSSKPTVCDDGNACTQDSCFPDVGCAFEPPRGQCVDSNPCTTDSCDPATGACSNKPVRRPWDATHELLECPGQDTWDASRNWCAVNGGKLALPTTDVQSATLASFAASIGVAGLWAPLQQAGGGANPWTWVDAGGSGDPVWCGGEPNDATGSEDCAEWQPASACLADSLCTDVRSFGCAIDTSIP